MKNQAKSLFTATLMMGALAILPTDSFLNAHSAKSLISWNVSSIKDSFLPRQTFAANCFCVWSYKKDSKNSWPLMLMSSADQSKQVVFDPETLKSVLNLEMGPIIQLSSLLIGEDRWAVGLSKEGKDLVLVNTQNPNDLRRLRIPVYYPLKRIAFYHRPSDGRLFLFGINALGNVLTQLEVTDGMKQITPLRSIDLKEDFLDRAYDIICDDEFGRIYAIGERGRLTCWDADPESTTKPVLFLQNTFAVEAQAEQNWKEAVPAAQNKWFLLKVDAQKNDDSYKTLGTIALVERPGMRVCLWARGLDETSSSRTLNLVGCRDLIALESIPEVGLVGLDAQGRICFFDSSDFTLRR